MAVVLLDDHFLRDWLAGPDAALKRAVARSTVATTNLWYARLCKSAACYGGGALLGSWSGKEREVVIAGLIALPESLVVIPMIDLAWRMGRLVHEFVGLSTLGSEAVAASEQLGARLLVSLRYVGPGIRNACAALKIRHQMLER
jgi:hypothetical protein